MRGEADLHRLARGLGQALLDLGQVAVRADGVGVHAILDLGEEQALLERAAGPGDARLGVDDDVVGDDRLGREQGLEGELRAGRIAAGIGREPVRAQRVAGVLGEPVDGLGLEVRCAVRAAVDPLVDGGVLQSKVGREVDDLEIAGQGCDHLLGRRVGQAAEDGIDLVEGHVVDLDERRQAAAGEMGEDLAHVLAGHPVGREVADLEFGMAEGQAQRLGAGVAARPQDCDPRRRRHRPPLRNCRPVA